MTATLDDVTRRKQADESAEQQTGEAAIDAQHGAVQGPANPGLVLVGDAGNRPVTPTVSMDSPESWCAPVVIEVAGFGLGGLAVVAAIVPYGWGVPTRPKQQAAMKAVGWQPLYRTKVAALWTSVCLRDASETLRSAAAMLPSRLLG